MDLAKVFHVVHVEAHHVADTTGEEHRVGTRGQGLLDVTLHQPEVFHPFGDDPGGGKVDITVGDTGGQHRDSCFIGRELELVDRSLPFGKGRAHRKGRGEIARITHRRFRTRVE